MSMVPKVYVDVPEYVDANQKFFIHVDVRIDDQTRLDSIEVIGAPEKGGMFVKALEKVKGIENLN